MATAKISSIILGIIAVSAIMALFAGLLTHGAANTGATFDEDALESYDQMESMSELVEDIHDSENSLSSNSETDILGDIFKQGTLTVMITQSMIDNVDTMSNDAVDDMNLGYSGKTLRVVLGVAFAVVVLFIFLAVILKWEI